MKTTTATAAPSMTRDHLGRAVEIEEEGSWLPFGCCSLARLPTALEEEEIAKDDHTTQQYALVYRQLRSQGTPIPTNDMWVAALVLQHNLALFARDRHFDHLPQIVRAD